jgi:tetratricopeptide (TPR) repeat protein
MTHKLPGMKSIMKMQPANTLQVLATAALLIAGTSSLINPGAATAAPTGVKLIAQSKMTAEDFLKRGENKRDNNDSIGAIADFTQAIKLKPDYVEAYYLRGRLLESTDKAGALADYNQAIKLNPKFADAHLGRISLRQAAGDLKGEIADSAKYAALTQNPIAYWQIGRLRGMTGDKQGAIADLQKAVNLYKESYDTNTPGYKEYEYAQLLEALDLCQITDCKEFEPL